MAITFLTPSEAGDNYLTELKALKPTVNTKQTDSDWWIRSRVVGGMAAGVYADQRLIANDAFPQSARREALARFLELYFNRGFNPATQSQGDVIFSGTMGSSLPAGTQFIYTPNGNVYLTQDTVVLDAATGTAVVQSVNSGQTQNLIEGAPLTISSPPPGIDATGTVGEDGLSDGRNEETEEEAKAVILLRIRQILSVGKESDYIQYALAADPAVVSARVVAYPFGLGTVGVYITSGTTDIDTAIDNGDPINVIPSDELVDTVQAYLQQNKPVTDCVTVFKPSPIEVDVTVRVRYKQGNGSTILSGQTLTQEELVQREVRRALYKTPVGGRVFDGTGYVLASEIEETIDVGLSAENVTVGRIPMLSDRQVDDLAATGTNRMVLQNEAITPGTITVNTF